MGFGDPGLKMFNFAGIIFILFIVEVQVTCGVFLYIIIVWLYHLSVHISLHLY